MIQIEGKFLPQGQSAINQIDPGSIWMDSKG